MDAPKLATQAGTGAVLLLSDQGTVLVHSGAESLLGAATPSDGHPGQCASLFAAESADALTEALRALAESTARASPRSLRLQPRSAPDRSVRLTLHRLAPGLIAGVVTGEDVSPGGGPSDIEVLERIWDRVGDAVALTSARGGSEEPRVTAANPAFCALFGKNVEALRGMEISHLLAPVGHEGLASRIRQRVLEAGESLTDVSLLGGPSRDPSFVEWELAPVRTSSGDIHGLIVVLRRPTSVAARIAPHRGPDVDPLTGLPSRVHLVNLLDRSVERAAQAPAYAFAVLGFDVHGLRAVERRLGTVVGNTVLEALAWRLRQRLRPGDVIARTGEHGLGVLLDYFAPWGSVEETLDRLRDAANEPYTIGGERMSLGVVATTGPVWTRERLPESSLDVLDEVSRALKRTKRTSGNLRQPRSSGPTKRASSDLARAVQSGELEVAYLPLVDVATARPHGLEALVRWRHPERGLLSGREFLAEAERSGLMLAIGRWVIWQVCHQLKGWQGAPVPERVLPVHINLSEAEFWNRELLPYLSRVSGDVGVDPSMIRLEVPEAAIARRVSSACRILEAFVEHGFEPWLDQFGEGGVRLQDLPRLPVRHVKVAPGLAWGSGGNGATTPPLLLSLLAVGRDLGWRVAVVGVETAEQRDLLGAAGCDLAEGFLFSASLDAERAGALARQSA